MNLRDTGRHALEVFRTFDEGEAPELFPTGIVALDQQIGGFGAGSCGVLAAGNGVGKSRVALAAVMASPESSGIICLEDGPEVIGSRALGMLSGVDAKRIRTKDLYKGEDELIRRALKNMRADVHFEFCIGGDSEDVADAVAALAEKGCKFVWLDYLHKVRDLNNGDRRNEVSGAYTRFNRALFKHGLGGIALCQFSRQPTTRRDGSHIEPQRWWLKESGDLENEARVIILMWRDQKVPTMVRGKLDKNAWGDEGMRFAFTQGPSGMLREDLANDDKW